MSRFQTLCRKLASIENQNHSATILEICKQNWAKSAVAGEIYETHWLPLGILHVIFVSPCERSLVGHHGSVSCAKLSVLKTITKSEKQACLATVAGNKLKKIRIYLESFNQTIRTRSYTESTIPRSDEENRVALEFLLATAAKEKCKSAKTKNKSQRDLRKYQKYHFQGKSGMRKDRVFQNMECVHLPEIWLNFLNRHLSLKSRLKTRHFWN